MNKLFIITQVNQLFSKPNNALKAIWNEPFTIVQILTKLVFPLILINAAADLVGQAWVAETELSFKEPAISGLVQLLTLFMWAYLVNELMPFFGGINHFTQTFKMLMFIVVPVFLGITLSHLFPPLKSAPVLIGLYSVWLLWLMFKQIPKVHSHRQRFATALSVLIFVLLYLIFAGLLNGLTSGF